VEAHPRGISRDELADRLWPESEGDKAVRNLYAATKDLRRALAPAPGVRLVARGGDYALETDENVVVLRARRG
jgi:DNA-binding SARP family transcriptional activator